MKYEEKFIVINVKRLEELNELTPTSDRMGVATFNREHQANHMLLDALESWKSAYENDTGKELSQKYYVVNQDEEYADEVWNLIKESEK